jgi:hypothetical protein
MVAECGCVVWAAGDFNAPGAEGTEKKREEQKNRVGI